MTIFQSYYLGQVCCNIKMANLAQIITLEILGAHFFFQSKSAETPMFIVFFANSVLKKTNLAQIITLEMAKLGPDNNFTAYIYSIYAVKLKTGPRFPFL